MDEETLKAKMEILADLIYQREQLEEKFKKDNKVLLDRIEEKKAEIKPEILSRKETVQSDKLTVQYRKGSVKWQTGWLEGYSVGHPEILKYRKETDPTVAFVLRED